MFYSSRFTCICFNFNFDGSCCLNVGFKAPLLWTPHLHTHTHLHTHSGYMRSMDVETSPDADTPRPCGVALLVCMLDRSRDAVAQTILALAAQIQSAASTPENVLLREACYRAIGECFTHLSQQVCVCRCVQMCVLHAVTNKALTRLYICTCCCCCCCVATCYYSSGDAQTLPLAAHASTDHAVDTGQFCRMVPK